MAKVDLKSANITKWNNMKQEVDSGTVKIGNENLSFVNVPALSFSYVNNNNTKIDKTKNYIGIVEKEQQQYQHTIAQNENVDADNKPESTPLTPINSPLSCRYKKENKKLNNIIDSRKDLRSIVSSRLRKMISTASPPYATNKRKRSSSRAMPSNYAVINKQRPRFKLIPSLGATSFLTLLTFICLETVLLSTVTNCAKTFYMHWNTSNSIFRIDNTDHIIDVNKGNLAFEFDQVHIICPVYEPGTYENETEKYIIYNVSKVEYETCRITNADPRVIAICDKPHKLMFFTITFRPFTPQPGGLEFLPGNDYYFISTSSKDDLYRRIGGRCSTNNMKVVFKVCCAPEERNNSLVSGGGGGSSSGGGGGADDSVINNHGNMKGGDTTTSLDTPTNVNQQQHGNNINSMNGINSGILVGGGGVNLNGNSGAVNIGHLNPLNGQSGVSINTNIDHFNRVPMQTNGINIIGGGVGVGGNSGLGSNLGGGGGIMLTPGHGGMNMVPTGSGIGIVQYNGQTGIRINNAPPQQHSPTHKINNHDDHHYDKHPNEVVKNEELTYNSGGSSPRRNYNKIDSIWKSSYMEEIIYKFLIGTQRQPVNRNIPKILTNDNLYILQKSIIFIRNIISLNPTILCSILMLYIIQLNLCSFKLYSKKKFTKSHGSDDDDIGLTNGLHYALVKTADFSNNLEQNIIIDNNNVIIR